jgi:superfamily I DNA/RNA helicase
LFERLKSAFKDDSFDLKKNKKILQKEFPLIFKFFYDPDFRDKNNKSYIASCKEKYASFFLDLDKKKQGLTDAQLEAVFCDEDAVLANAGAGTGKTKTIESKILHLVVHKNIPIENILVLTFTEKSKTDMLNRIIASLKTAGIDKSSEDLRRNVCTFHSLGKYILDQVASRDKKKGINSENIFSKVIDADEKDKLYSQTFFEIQKDKTIQAALSDYWLYYNIPELDVRTFKTLDEYYERTKSSYQTLLQKNGYNVTVKSFGEYLIANYLWSR